MKRPLMPPQKTLIEYIEELEKKVKKLEKLVILYKYLNPLSYFYLWLKRLKIC